MSAKLAFFLAASAAAVNVKTEERTLIHPERREQLNKINAMATTWTAKAGRWAREAPGASAPVLGHLGDNKLNVAAAKERGEVVDFVARDEISDIPESFDSATNWPQCAKIISDIRDQSNCGCCWAFAAPAAFARPVPARVRRQRSADLLLLALHLGAESIRPSCSIGFYKIPRERLPGPLSTCIFFR